MKVAFVLPNSLGAYGSANLNVEHLGIALLSAVLTENGYSNEIIDARMYNSQSRLVSPKKPKSTAVEEMPYCRYITIAAIIS